MLVPETTILGRYHLQRLLGQGGMAEVYLAHDELMHCDVAIKMINSSQDDYIARFQREIETMSALTHDHILPILDFGKQSPWYYLVMPSIEQGTLRERLAKDPLTLEEAGSILEQIASALQFAHDCGILHRDIKPSNILLENGHHVYLADFGIAKAIDGSSDLTQTGYFPGTPEYMAPELANWPATTSCDIYALGIVLYQMVTGRVPFKGASPLVISWKHILEQPVRPSLLNPAISDPVEQVILCALEKDPNRRFKTATALAHAYKQALHIPDIVEAHWIVSNEKMGDRKGNLYSAPTEINTAQSPTQQTLPWLQRPHSSIRPAVAALVVLVFLLVTSLSLRFLAFNSNNRTQHAPRIHVTSTSVPSAIPTATQQRHSIPTPQNTPALKTSAGVPAKQQPRHAHKHGHAHKHKHGMIKEVVV